MKVGAALALLLISATASAETLVTSRVRGTLGVTVRATDRDCTIVIAGRPIAYGPAADAEIDRTLAAWPTRSAVVESEATTPYSCVGAAIHALQRAQFGITLSRAMSQSWSEFLERQRNAARGEPAPVTAELKDRDGTCRARVEGQAFALPVDQDRLHADFRALAARGVTIVLSARTDQASFSCFRETMWIAQTAGANVSFLSEPAPQP